MWLGNSVLSTHRTVTCALNGKHMCAGEENKINSLWNFSLGFFCCFFKLIRLQFETKNMYNDVHVECFISELHLKSVQAHQCNNKTVCNNNNNWSCCLPLLLHKIRIWAKYYMCTIFRLLSTKCRACARALSTAQSSLKTCNCLLYSYINEYVLLLGVCTA